MQAVPFAQSTTALIFLSPRLIEFLINFLSLIGLKLSMDNGLMG